MTGASHIKTWGHGIPERGNTDCKGLDVQVSDGQQAKFPED